MHVCMCTYSLRLEGRVVCEDADVVHDVGPLRLAVYRCGEDAWHLARVRVRVRVRVRARVTVRARVKVRARVTVRGMLGTFWCQRSHTVWKLEASSFMRPGLTCRLVVSTLCRHTPLMTTRRHSLLTTRRHNLLTTRRHN